MDAPLDVIVVRKLGVPSQPELGMGAIGEDGVCVLNPEVIRHLSITERRLARASRRPNGPSSSDAPSSTDRDAPMIPLEGRIVVVIDDGLATGSTARAAIEVARAHGAERVVLVVPVAPQDTVDELGGVADDVICVASPQPFTSIGQWYADFRQTTDAEVSELLQRATRPATRVDQREIGGGSGREVAGEPVERAVPAVFRRRFVVALASVAVEPVAGVRVTDDLGVHRATRRIGAEVLDTVDRDHLVLVAEQTEPRCLQRASLVSAANRPCPGCCA